MTKDKSTMATQQTFNFDAPAKEPTHVAEQASLPPPLLRPDRQCLMDGLPSYEWPKPQHDRDAITVDRLHVDIEGQAHRFTIKRDDYVEVFFRKDRLE